MVTLSTPLAPGAAPSAQALAQAADVLAFPLLLLDAQAQLLHANRAALRLLADGGWLRQGADGRIATHHALTTLALQRAVAQAAAGERQFLSPPSESGLGLAALSRLAPAADLGVAARGERMADSQPGTGAALVLLALAGERDRGSDLSGYAAVHGLTPAEVRVLAALVLGKAPAQGAQSLGVSLSTVRSQIAALRRKTGRRTLVALLADVARLPPTLG